MCTNNIKNLNDILNVTFTNLNTTKFVFKLFHSMITSLKRL